METRQITDVIFDFDQTITANHLHNTLVAFLTERALTHPYQTRQIDGERIIPAWTQEELKDMWDFIQNSKPPLTALNGTIEQWRAIFRNLIDAGVNVSVASFTSFGPIVQQFFTDIILTPEDAAKIHFETWLPKEGQRHTKNIHLDHSLGIRDEPEKRAERYAQTLFFEDSQRNVNSMNAVNNHKIESGIKVPEGNPYNIPDNARLIAARLNQELGLTIPIIPLELAQETAARKPAPPPPSIPSSTARLRTNFNMKSSAPEVSQPQQATEQEMREKSFIEEVVRHPREHGYGTARFKFPKQGGVELAFNFSANRVEQYHLIQLQQLSNVGLLANLIQQPQIQPVKIDIQQLEFKNMNDETLKSFFKLFQQEELKRLFSTLPTDKLKELGNRNLTNPVIAEIINERATVLESLHRFQSHFEDALGEKKWTSLTEIPNHQGKHKEKDQALYELKKVFSDYENQLSTGSYNGDLKAIDLSTQVKDKLFKAIKASVEYQGSKLFGKVGMTQSDTAHDLLAVYMNNFNGNLNDFAGIKGMDKYLKQFQAEPERTSKRLSH